MRGDIKMKIVIEMFFICLLLFSTVGIATANTKTAKTIVRVIPNSEIIDESVNLDIKGSETVETKEDNMKIPNVLYYFYNVMYNINSNNLLLILYMSDLL